MTRSTFVVRFPDGTERYGLYNNTVDEFWRGLHASEDEAWGPMYDAYRSRDWETFKRVAYPEPVGEVVAVKVLVDPHTPECGWVTNGHATQNALVDVVDPDAA